MCIPVVPNAQWNILENSLLHIRCMFRHLVNPPVPQNLVFFNIATSSFLLVLWVLLCCYTWDSYCSEHLLSHMNSCLGRHSCLLWTWPGCSKGVSWSNTRTLEHIAQRRWVESSILGRWIKEQRRPSDRFVSWKGIDRTGEARSQLRRAQGGRNCLSPTEKSIRILQALQMKTGGLLLKLLTQRGHLPCSSWGAGFFLFSFCGRVALLLSHVWFPSISSWWYHEKWALEVNFHIFFCFKRVPAA